MKFRFKIIMKPQIKIVSGILLAFLVSIHNVDVKAAQKHILQKGENLSELAKKYKVSVKELIRLNKIKNTKAMRAGKAVLIPDSKQTSKIPVSALPQKIKSKPDLKASAPKNSSVKIVKYKILKGDTIWTLSKRFNASTKEIKTLNKLKENKVKIGKTLFIPSKSRKTAVIAKNKPSYTKTGGTQSVTVIHGTGVTQAVQNENSKHYDVVQEKPVSVFRYVKGENVRVRMGPGIEFDEIDHLSFGSIVEILEKNENWIKVKNKQGFEGWCLGVFLSTAKPKRTEYESDIFASTPNQKVVKIAYSYLGIRYRWGGITSRGFDCSGFVLAMYRKIGINLPHSAAAQFGVGKPVAFSNLKPGDRVYFQTYKRGASHVGIYIGGGKFIHASSAKHGVIISSLFENYYSKRYLGARR